jgi:hypothetical protein
VRAGPSPLNADRGFERRASFGVGYFFKSSSSFSLRATRRARALPLQHPACPAIFRGVGAALPAARSRGGLSWHVFMRRTLPLREAVCVATTGRGGRGAARPCRVDVLDVVFAEESGADQCPSFPPPSSSNFFDFFFFLFFWWLRRVPITFVHGPCSNELTKSCPSFSLSVSLCLSLSSLSISANTRALCCVCTQPCSGA